MHPGAHAETTPDKPAVIMAGSGEVVTYKQLDDRSNQLAQLFYERGLRPGDAIAVYMENNSHYHEVLWAAQRSGLYYTAISYRLTAPEVEYIVNDCGAKAFVTSHSQRDVAAELVAGDMMPNVHTRLMLDGTIDGYESYEDVVDAQPAEPIAEQTEGSDMLYSSGTTGRPKGVKVPLPDSPLGTPDGVTVLCQALYGVTADRSTSRPRRSTTPRRCASPWPQQRLGGTVVVMEHFDPMEYLRLIEKHKVTHTQVVPTMFVRMLKLPEEEREKPDVSSLQVVIHAAAPCPVPVKEQMIEWWGPVIYEYYAGTEGNGFVCCNSEEWLAHKGTVGKAILGTVHIVDDDGNELPTGESGTIYFEGGAEFEYHNDPEKTKGSRNDRGWTTLGDIGYLDDDGYLYLTDRKAYMIISRRREHLPAGGGERPHHAPQGDGRRRVRRAQRGLRRGGEGRRAARRHGRRRPRPRARAHRLLPRAPGRRQVPPLGRLRRRAPPPPHRQALQAPAEGPLLGQVGEHAGQDRPGVDRSQVRRVDPCRVGRLAGPERIEQLVAVAHEEVAGGADAVDVHADPPADLDHQHRQRDRDAAPPVEHDVEERVLRGVVLVFSGAGQALLDEQHADQLVDRRGAQGGRQVFETVELAGHVDVVVVGGDEQWRPRRGETTPRAR